MPARTYYDAAMRGRVRASVSGGIVVLLVSVGARILDFFRGPTCPAHFCTDVCAGELADIPADCACCISSFRPGPMQLVSLAVSFVDLVLRVQAASLLAHADSDGLVVWFGRRKLLAWCVAVCGCALVFDLWPSGDDGILSFGVSEALLVAAMILALLAATQVRALLETPSRRRRPQGRRGGAERPGVPRAANLPRATSVTAVAEPVEVIVVESTDVSAPGSTSLAQVAVALPVRSDAAAIQLGAVPASPVASLNSGDVARPAPSTASLTPIVTGTRVS